MLEVTVLWVIAAALYATLPLIPELTAVRVTV